MELNDYKMEPAYALLLQLRNELYGRSWKKMLDDLEERKNRKPYVHAKVTAIEEDIARIMDLSEWEKRIKHERNVSLEAYLKQAEQSSPASAPAKSA